MARGFYTVIVGTQPGIYTDWTQAALRVSEISGAIFKKYNTYPDALEAFNNAARDGKVRAIQLDPEPEAELPPGSQVREQAPHEYPVVRPIILHSDTRPGQSFHKRRTTKSSPGAGISPSIYASQSDLAERTGHGTTCTELREYQSFGQPSRPAGGNQVLLPTGSRSRGHSSERWQESQHDSARALPTLSRADRGTTFAHCEAISASTSAEPGGRRLVLESPSVALSRSPQPGPSAHRVFRSPQINDNRFRVPGNVARQHDRPLSPSPLAGVRPDDARSNSSDGFSFNPATPLVNRPLYVEPSHASGSQGPNVNPAASPRAHAHGMSDRKGKGKKRASVQSPDAYIDSFDWSEVRRSVPSPQPGTIEIGDSLSPPGLFLRSSSPCSHISVASSNETLSVFSFEVNISAVEIPGSPGRSAHVASSNPPTPQLTVSPFAVSSLVENAIPDPSTQGQEGLNREENGDNSQDLQVSSGGNARFGNLGDVDVVDPASVKDTDSSRSDLSVLFEDSPTLTRLQSPSKVASTSRASTHLPTQSIRPSGLDSTSPPRVWPLWSPSLPPYVDQEASSSTEVSGLGLSIEGIMSPRSPSRPLQQQMTIRAPLRIQPQRHAGIDRQSTTGDDAFPRDAAAPSPQAQESPSYLRSAMSNIMQQQQQQSRGTRSTNNTAPLNSPSNIPLPSSPTTSTPSGSPARLRLQAQPSHRSSPHMPFYPTLTVDREGGQQQQQQHTLLSPSGLDVPLGFASGFGRPTPHPSPIQAPVPAPPAPAPTPALAIRTPSPSADPRSPISRLTQIRGSIMGLSRNFLFGRPTGTPPP